MALPSARRPVAVVEEIEEKKKEDLKVVLKKDQWIMKALGEWCENLSTKNKATLTRKVLARRATLEAYKLKFDYNKLPENWMRTLLNEHKLTLYKRKKKYPKHEIDMAGNSSDEEQVNSFKDQTPAEPVRKKSRPTLVRQSQPTSFYPTTPTATPRVSTSSSGRTPNARPYKKLVDLSNEPPPGWWLQEYAKGIVPKRELRVYSTDDQNIIFYDYTQDDVKGEDSKYVRRPHDHDKIDFDWWAKQTKETEARKRAM